MRTSSLLFLLAATLPGAELSITAVTCFKDGHALVQRQGRLPVAEDGSLVSDGVPQAVCGTLWGRVEGGRLRALVGSPSRGGGVNDLVALLRLHRDMGKMVEVTEQTPEGKVLSYQAQVEEVLPASQAVPQTVLLRRERSVRAVPFARIVALEFPEAPPAREAQVPVRLRWEPEWPGGRAPAPGSQVEVTLSALEPGLRWTPSYRVELQAGKQAQLALQATFRNDLGDLVDAQVTAMVGVPSFIAKDLPDPLATLGPIDRFEQALGLRSRLNRFDNNRQWMNSQMVLPQEEAGVATATADGPAFAATAAEDMLALPLGRLTLVKGGRASLAVGESALAYADSYRLEVPVSLPREAWQGRRHDDQAVEGLLKRPQVWHTVELANASGRALTTGPALVLRNGIPVAQGVLPFTPPGATARLRLTTAPDIRVDQADEEMGRTVNAIEISGTRYTRLRMGGRLTLTNQRSEAVTIQVVRFLLGKVGEVAEGCTRTTINQQEDDSWWKLPDEQGHGAWSWWYWPSWVLRLNPVERLSWTVTLPPGQPVTLAYGWETLIHQ